MFKKIDWNFTGVLMGSQRTARLSGRSPPMEMKKPVLSAAMDIVTQHLVKATPITHMIDRDG